MISLAIPCPSPFGFHWPINFTKKNYVFVYFQKTKEKVTSFSGTLLFTSFFCWKYTESSICLEKLICQCIPDRDGRGMARMSKKNIFTSKKRQKMVTKLGQFTKMGHLGFLNCPNFVTIFCQVLKMEIIFFDIPSYPPPIAVRNSLTNHFFQKNWRFCIFSKQKKIMQNWREEKGHFSFLNCPNFVTIFGQVLKMEIIFFWYP